MRQAFWSAAGLALLAVLSWSSPPAQAMAITAPAALKAAVDGIAVTQTVQCWDCGGYDRRRYNPYRSYQNYGPRRYTGYYDRPYYDYRPRHYRPYRSYDGGYRRYDGGYRSYDGGYRPHYRQPNYYYFGPRIYSF